MASLLEFEAFVGRLGERGLPGAQVIAGASTPTSEDGNLGDWWIYKESDEQWHLYGPKGESGWPATSLPLRGVQGPQGVQGLRGHRGYVGWSPRMALVVHGDDLVLQLVEWVGGEDAKPLGEGWYVGPGPEGLVEDPAEATTVWSEAIAIKQAVEAAAGALWQESVEAFSFTGDGTQTVFDLGYPISQPEQVLWFEDGIWQQPGEHFTVEGTEVTRAEAPADGAAIRGVILLRPGDMTLLSDAEPEELGEASPGEADQAARADHVHPHNLGDDSPKVAGMPSAGEAMKASREDHVHPQDGALANAAATAARAERLGWPMLHGINVIAIPELPLPSYVSLVSPGNRWDWGPNGDLREFGENEIRHAYDPQTRKYLGYRYSRVSRTNGIRNNTMQGASAPSTPPTNWDVTNAAGITREIIGTGTYKGMAYVDIRWSGTANTNAAYIQSFEAVGQIAAANAQVWTVSCGFQILDDTGGTFPTTRLAISQYNSGGSNLGTVDSIIVPTASVQRFSATLTLNQANTVSIRPRFYFTVVNGTTYDFTLRIFIPQCEQSPFATTPILTSGSAVTVPGEVMNVPVPAHLWSERELTLVWRGRVFGVPASATAIMTIDDGTAANRHQLQQTSGGAILATSVDGSSTQASMTLVANQPLGVEVALSAKIKADDFAASRNGAAALTDTSGSFGAVDPVVKLGYRQAASTPMLEHCISQFALFPAAPSNSEVEALSRLVPA